MKEWRRTASIYSLRIGRGVTSSELEGETKQEIPIDPRKLPVQVFRSYGIVSRW